MKRLLKYQWVKLPRSQMPAGKGVMGAWARLASRAAFRNGQARYCGYINQVTIGSWAGGIVGLKSILGIKNRSKALQDRACRVWQFHQACHSHPQLSQPGQRRCQPSAQDHYRGGPDAETPGHPVADR